ncbi:YgaP family membrane protein [Kaarinaea lacus]
MTIERFVLAFAGFMIVTSVVLSQVHSIYWLGFTAFIGLNMFQSAFTGFCPLAKILKSFGRKTGPAFS